MDTPEAQLINSIVNYLHIRKESIYEQNKETINNVILSVSSILGYLADYTHSLSSQSKDTNQETKDESK